MEEEDNMSVVTHKQGNITCRPSGGSNNIVIQECGSGPLGEPTAFSGGNVDAGKDGTKAGDVMAFLFSEREDMQKALFKFWAIGLDRGQYFQAQVERDIKSLMELHHMSEDDAWVYFASIDFDMSKVEHTVNGD